MIRGMMIVGSAPGAAEGVAEVVNEATEDSAQDGALELSSLSSLSSASPRRVRARPRTTREIVRLRAFVQDPRLVAEDEEAPEDVAGRPPPTSPVRGAMNGTNRANRRSNAGQTELTPST